MMKTISLVVESWDGHHPTYCKIFTKTLLDLDNEVIVLCPNPDELFEWIKSECPSKQEKLYALKIDKFNTESYYKTKIYPFSRIYQALILLSRWRFIANSIQNAISIVGKSPDLVFFCFLDNYLGSLVSYRLVDKIFPYHWSGLYFVPTHLRKKLKLNFLRRGILDEDNILRSKNSKPVAILDEGIADELKYKLKNKPVVIFPDFTDDSYPNMDFELVKQIKEKSKGRKIIGLLGFLDKRKGVVKLLEIALQAKHENWFFVFVGELNKQSFSAEELILIDNTIAEYPENCFFHFERIYNESDYNAVFSTCDVIFNFHDYPHSSNTLTKASIFRKPVISNDKFCIGERVKKFELGATVSDESISSCIKILRKLCNEPWTISPKVEEYRRIHSVEQLKYKFLQILPKV